MDNNTVDLNESMADLIERAEAFLSAHATLARTPPTAATQSNRSSSSNMFDSSSSVEEQESFTTADESHGSSSSSSSSASSNNSTPPPSQIELLTDDSEDSDSTISYEVDLPDAVPYIPPVTDADDCIFVSSVVVPTIDLCSQVDDDNVQLVTPQTRQNRVRRRAESAPIVDLITLDDTIADQPVQQPAGSSVTLSVEDDRVVQPPAKRSKDSVPDLDLSQSSDGGAPSRSVLCPICFDSIFKKQASSTVCGHLFCFSCIKQEIQMRHKCPLCKRKLTRAQIHPIYFN